MTMLPVEPMTGGAAGLALSLSPDGATLVYRSSESGTGMLVRRHMADFGSESLAGTEGAVAVFFSPDGQEVAFFGCFRNQLLVSSP